MDKAELEKLANLARISISKEEQGRLTKDMEAIVGYVSRIRQAAGGKSGQRGKMEAPGLARNVMREDGKPHEPGIYTEELLNAAPRRENGYVKVKKIL